MKYIFQANQAPAATVGLYKSDRRRRMVGARRRSDPITRGRNEVELEPLLEACRRGDELAWEALVRRYQARVYALCYHYLRDREEARDVAQETFVRVYRALGRFRRGGNFVGWLLRIARNCCLDRLRKLANAPAYRAASVEESVAGADPGPGPEDSTSASDRRRLLQRALDRMTAINREMILLKDIQGLKQREIADLLSIPLGTVKARSNRARMELAARIIELDPSYGG